MNRRGEEKIMILYWLAIFIIIALGVVSGVVNFYGNPFDFRAKEASILADKLIECVSEKGILTEGAELIEDIEGECGLYFSSDDYYVFLKIGDMEIEEGNVAIRALCTASESAWRRPACSEKKLFVLKEGEMIFIEAIGGVLKINENAR